MNYQEQLLKNYILSEIYSIEKKDLLEEGKIFDWFKSKFNDIAGDTDIIKACKEFLEKTKYKKDRKTQRQRKGTQMALELEQNKRSRFKIFALAALMAASLIGKGINNPSPQDFRSAQEVAEQQVESNSPTSQNIDGEDLPDEVIRTTEAIKGMSKEEERKAIMALFGLTDADFDEQEENPQIQKTAKDKMYDFIERDITISEIDNMSEEDIEVLMDKLNKFSAEEAFKLSDREHDDIQGILFLTDASLSSRGVDGNVGSKRSLPAGERRNILRRIEGSISQTKKDLNAIQDFKQTVRIWSAEDTDRMTDEIYQKYKDRTQSIGMKHIKDLRDLQDKAVERGEDSSRYDDLIEQSEEAFFDSFGFEINYDSSEN